MKTLAISILISGLVIFIMAFQSDGKPGTEDNKSVASGFAVVELFTSEGCSSCPAADALIANIQKENVGKPVYILAFHVDYWNRLGWKDIFSDPAFTKRQQHYANWLKLASVYTPQAVVNGKTEFVGSQATSMRKAITESLNKKQELSLRLDHVKALEEKVVFDYHVNTLNPNISLVLALVQKKAETKVRSGENAGRTLSHVQITRAIQTINLDKKASGSGQITIPAGLKPENLEVIGFLQHDHNGEIVAATKAFPEP